MNEKTICVTSILVVLTLFIEFWMERGFRRIRIEKAKLDAYEDAARIVENGPTVPVVFLVEGKINSLPDKSAEYLKSLASLIRNRAQEIRRHD